MTSDEQAHDAVVAAVRNLLLIRLTRSLEASPSLGTGSLSLPGSAYIQWTQVDHETRVLHVEINEGTYENPMPQDLVDLLVPFGWHTPDEQFRNAWMRSADGPDPAELADIADTLIVTATVGFGLSPVQLGVLIMSHR